jgi:cell division protein FtsB
VLGSLSATAYFVQHTIAGPHGLSARARFAERAIALQHELDVAGGVRDRFRRNVALLSSTPPDPDIVEELARAQLGFARPGDRLLVLGGAR